MTVFAHWVMDDVNTSAKTCASRLSLAPVLDFSNVVTLSKVAQADYPITKGSSTKRNIAGVSALTSGTTLATCLTGYDMFTKHGVFSCDMVIKLSSLLSFAVNMRDHDTTTFSHRFNVSFESDGRIGFRPQQFKSPGSSNDTTNYYFNYRNAGIAAFGELALLSMEVDCSAPSTSGGRALYRVYLNGEDCFGTIVSNRVSADEWDSGGGLEDFQLFTTAGSLMGTSSTMDFLAEIMLHNTKHMLGRERARARYLRWRRRINGV